MKTAIVTDLHANRQAVEAVLEDVQRHGADRLVFLGDYVGYGADPGWVVDRVRKAVEDGAIAVVGNHDAAVTNGGTSTMRDEVQRVIEWTHANLSADQIGFLASLPMTHEEPGVLFVHANAWAPGGWGYIDGRSEAVRSLQATRQRLTFCGHTHDPCLYHLSALGRAGEFRPTAGVPVPLLPMRRWLTVAGACGQPRDGDPSACYGVYDDEAGTFTLWRVAYDVDAAQASILAAGLPPQLAWRLERGI